MSGFPTRTSLSAFGTFPRKNFGGVRGDDLYCLNEEYLNLVCWQLGGMGLLAPKAMLVFETLNDAAPTVLAHFEAWRPRGDGPAPTPARTAEGVFTFTYLATVQDMDELDVSPGLQWVDQPSLQGAVVDAVIRGRATAENVVTVNLYAAGVAADLPGSRILVVVR